MRNNRYYASKQFNRPYEKGGVDAGQSNAEMQAHEPVQAEYLEVEVFGNFDKAMRSFRAKVQKERILSLFKEKQSFEKPSDKKRRKRNEMKRKLIELEMKEDAPPRFKARRDREEDNFNNVQG